MRSALQPSGGFPTAGGLQYQAVLSVGSSDSTDVAGAALVPTLERAGVRYDGVETTSCCGKVRRGCRSFGGRLSQ